MKRFFLPLLLLLLLSGCSLFDTSDLYCLPEASKDYYDLQEALSDVMEQGLSYAAPTSGARRETVQLVDLSGDGTDEAVAFFRNQQDNTIGCYIFSKESGVYETAAVIDCVGTDVASVEYADLDGDGCLELLLACQVSQTVPQALQVCRYTREETVTMEIISCSRYVLSELDKTWLLCFSDNGSDPGTVGCYSMEQGTLERATELSLSGRQQDILTIDQIVLEDDTPALAVVLNQDDCETVCDLIAQTGGQLSKIKSDVLRSDNLRGGTLYPRDMDEDGRAEIPQTVQMEPYDDGASPQSLVIWYGVDSGGNARQKLVSYLDMGDKWYLTLPDCWLGNVLVKQTDTADGTGSVGQTIFYRLDENGKAGEELLTIYTVKGSGQQEYAEEQGISVLYANAEVLYGVKINDRAEHWEGTVTMNQVSDGFHPLEP